MKKYILVLTILSITITATELPVEVQGAVNYLKQNSKNLLNHLPYYHNLQAIGEDLSLHTPLLTANYTTNTSQPIINEACILAGTEEHTSTIRTNTVTLAQVMSRVLTESFALPDPLGLGNQKMEVGKYKDRYYFVTVDQSLNPHHESNYHQSWYLSNDSLRPIESYVSDKKCFYGSPVKCSLHECSSGEKNTKHKNYWRILYLDSVKKEVKEYYTWIAIPYTKREIAIRAVAYTTSLLGVLGAGYMLYKNKNYLLEKYSNSFLSNMFASKNCF